MPDSVTFLGTSDGLPSPNRRHASLLVKFASRTILMDCGEPCGHTLKKMGEDFDAIDMVVISHTHSDHIGGLPMLLQSMWLEGRKRPLTVWMPGHAIRLVREWLNACYLFEPLLGFPVKWVAFDKHPAMRCGPVQLRAFRTSHLDGLRKQFGTAHPMVRFDAFSLLATGGGKRLAYSADMGSPQDLRPLCVKPLDLLVVELAHFQPKALFEFLQSKVMRRVAITHMGRPVRARLAEVSALARKELGPRKTQFVNDGDVIKF
jgi:phosphoribosyl 1,2-cyclic phosphodiesterase